MKVNKYIRRIVACLSLAIAPCIFINSTASAGVELKPVSIEKSTYGDTTKTVTKYAPAFTYNGSVTLPSTVSPDLAVTIGQASIKGSVEMPDNGSPVVHYSVKFNVANETSRCNTEEQYKKILSEKNWWMPAKNAYQFILLHENNHMLDAAQHPAIALLALEPSITVKDAAIKQRLDSTRTTLLSTLEARALFAETMTTTIRNLVIAGAHSNAAYDESIESGHSEQYAIYASTSCYSDDDYVEKSIKSIQQRYTQLNLTGNCREIISAVYGDPVIYGNKLLDVYPDNSVPHYDINGSSDQLSSYNFSVADADALDKLLNADKCNPDAKLREAVRDYEDAVKAALIAMCKTTIEEERKEEPITEEEQTDSLSGKPIVIICDGPENDNNKEVKQPTEKKETQPTEKTNSGSAHNLPELLPFTNDFAQLMLDTSYYELEKLAEIINYVQDAESAAAVSQGGDNSLLNRWLAQYTAKVQKIAADKDKGDNESQVFKIAFYMVGEFDYKGKMMNLRNEKFAPALNRVYSNNCYGNEELHNQLLNIYNKTTIFVDGKMQPIHTIRDYANNIRFK